MPESETTTMLIEPNSGHSRQTKSWVLGRLWRYFNDHLDSAMREEREHDAAAGDFLEKQQKIPHADMMRDERQGEGGKPHFEALRVTIFQLDDGVDSSQQGVPALDWV